MALPTDILLMYGYLLLFAWVLVEQLGLPLPSTPVLLAAGALSAQRQISFPLALAVGVAASLTADSVWFFIGRTHGHHVLRLLCKLSLEPTTCVRRTQDSFGRRRGAMLMFAKFVPGLSTLAPPVAGQNGMRFGLFLLYDGIGSAFWVGVTAGLRQIFRRPAQAQSQPARLGRPLLRRAADSGCRGILPRAPRSPPRGAEEARRLAP